QRAVAIDPERTEAHFAVARAAEDMCNPNAQPQRDEHRCELAIAEYKTVLQIDPHHPESQINLAYLLYQFNRLDEAETYYRLAFAANPNNADVLGALAALQYWRSWKDIALAKAGVDPAGRKSLIRFKACRDVRDRNLAGSERRDRT